MNKRQLGLTIQQIRKSKGLTTKALATAISITPDYLSRIERGLANITVERLLELASRLQCEPNMLVEAALNCVAPTFANHDYNNDRLDRLDFHTKIILHHMIGDLSEDEPTITSWRGTVFKDGKPAQVQLRVTMDPANWEDED